MGGEAGGQFSGQGLNRPAQLVQLSAPRDEEVDAVGGGRDGAAGDLVGAATLGDPASRLGAHAPAERLDAAADLVRLEPVGELVLAGGPRPDPREDPGEQGLRAQPGQRLVRGPAVGAVRRTRSSGPARAARAVRRAVAAEAVHRLGRQLVEQFLVVGGERGGEPLAQVGRVGVLPRTPGARLVPGVLRGADTPGKVQIEDGVEDGPLPLAVQQRRRQALPQVLAVGQAERLDGEPGVDGLAGADPDPVRAQRLHERGEPLRDAGRRRAHTASRSSLAAAFSTSS